MQEKAENDMDTGSNIGVYRSPHGLQGSMQAGGAEFRAVPEPQSLIPKALNPKGQSLEPKL